MALLNILHFPDPRLRNKALPVAQVNDEIRTLVENMFETMYANQGIGLAATQVNVAQRVVVMDVSMQKDKPLCFINPEITLRDGNVESEEGCLSVPDTYDAVQRAATITVRALDRTGKAFELNADGLLAICIQHEIDHLDGKLFVDYLSPLKKQRIRKRLEKQERLERQRQAI